MESVFVRPRRRENGALVVLRDPATGGVVPESGEWKPLTRFWRNRIKDGDAVAGQPSASAPATPAPAPVKSKSA